MDVWSVAVESRKWHRDQLWGKFPWTQQIGRALADVPGRALTDVPGRAPADLISRNQPLPHKQASRCGTSARQPARALGYAAGDGAFCKSSGQEPLLVSTLGVDTGEEMGRRAWEATWSLSHDADPLGTATDDRGVTDETVSKLCHEGHVTEAVEALGVLVQTGRRVSKSLLYAVLRQCVHKKEVVLGRRVHAFTVIKGFQADTFLCNHILRMYASHGRLQEAMDVFTVVAEPDTFMWASIISAHAKHGQSKQAIQLYHRMRASSLKPDGHVFVAVLQACARVSDLKTGQQVHADVLDRAVEPHLFVSNCLVDMYAKCGSLEDAQNVFDALGQKDVATWTALISGYSKRGMGHEALILYSAMQEEDIAVPNAMTFVCLLQSCASVGNHALPKGKQLHLQITEGGLGGDVFIATSLVNMYAKCGSLEDAQQVFNGLDQKDVVTWTAMIAGYSQQGMGQEALRLYSDMQEEGIAVPNSVTFVCLLKACASVGILALEKGKQLHAQIIKGGHQDDVFVANSLVNMYAKCGSLEDAHTVFDGLGQKDVVTWNAMISGYSQQGRGQEALLIYSAMQEEGIIVPDSVTLVCLLQACASVGPPALEKGRQLHLQVRQLVDQADVFVASSLVNMYAKCGSVQDAQRVFDGLGEKNVVAWTAMIAGYAQQGMGEEALALYSGMQDCGIAVPNSVTYVCLLQACASAGPSALEKGKQLHSHIRGGGHDVDVFVGNSLVNMYAKCGSLEEARRVFDGLGEKDVVTWNAMIAGYSQQGMGQEALRLYRSMQEEGMAVPDAVTLVCLFQACASVGTPALEEGKQIHAQVREHGHKTDAMVANSLVNMFAKCGSLQEAQLVFDGLGQKDVATWNAMISGYSQQGKGHDALRVYRAMLEEGIAVPDSVTYVSLLQACASVGNSALEEGKELHKQIREGGHEANVFVASSLINMYAKCGSLEDAQRVFDGLLGEKNVVTWTAMIAGYSQQGMGHKALRLYSAMQEEGLAVPDSVTFVCLLQACADVAALHLGRELHVKIREQGLEGNLFVANSLVNMYGKSGSMADAQTVFDGMHIRDVVTWSALIAGHTYQGNTEIVFDLFEKMIEGGIQPAGITFLSVLTACSHAGLVNKGREYFDAMSRDYGIPPTLEHYTCLVDILGRAGQLDEAFALARSMPVLPNAAVWHTLLGACQKWSNVEIGRHAFDKAVTLDNKDSAAYMLMSNIYTGAEMWEQAEEMQACRKGMSAWKQPGQSWWSDMDGLVHSFLVEAG